MSENLQVAIDGDAPDPIRILFADLDIPGNIDGHSSTQNVGITGYMIQTLTAQGVLTTVAGGNAQPAPDWTPLRDAWFFGPISLAISHSGDLYIGEFGACLIRKIDASGVLSTFAPTVKCGQPARDGQCRTHTRLPGHSGSRVPHSGHRSCEVAGQRG